MSQEFPNQLRAAINSCSNENGSNTPDFILTSFLIDVLGAWDKAVTAREKWYGREPKQITVDGDVFPTPTGEEGR